MNNEDGAFPAKDVQDTGILPGEGSENDEYAGISNLLLMLGKTGKKYDIDKIKKAYLFARELHEGQFRVSGEAYISHPVAVAEIVAGMELDTDSICAALLHDVVEDCVGKVDLPIIRAEFGETVELLVDGLTKLVQIPFEDKEEKHIENLRKMLLAMSKDIRVIFIKLCDRLHNMRTLSAKPPAKQRVTALETMQVFAPLAHRLGMQRIKQELENLSLYYLDPIGYEEIRSHIDQKYGQSRDFIENARAQIQEGMEKAGIEFTLDGRVKTVYSIYHKMYEQNKSFDEIYDFYAVRILVSTELECYTALGVIHDMFHSVPGRFKDYISTPKPNMYRSLHTTVIGRGGIPFEVQIRTWEMHRIAEYGVAAHWKYKSGERSSEEVDRKLSWVMKLIETEDDTRDPEEFLQALKVDIFHDETFVFTPKGDVITLPQGSTVVDFAYAIHSQIGNKMVGAKINGMIVPFERIPENGEIVEILTSSASKGPSRDWLKIVKTGEARNKIRQWFKKEKRPENIAVGKTEIERELKKFQRSMTEQQKTEILENVTERLGIQSVDDLFNTIGYGGLAVSKISAKLRDEVERVCRVEEPEEAPIGVSDVPLTELSPAHRSTSGVIVDGVDGCTVKFARCCNPVPGDSIIGFITKGFGISIHKQDCPNVRRGIADDENRPRWISAKWSVGEDSRSSSLFEATLHIAAEDRIAMIADISAALADMKVSIIQLNTQTRPAGNIITVVIGCKSLEHVRSIVSRLRAIPGVASVQRGYN